MKLPHLLEIEPLTRPPFVPVPVPGSKHITDRALILAALGQGHHVLRDVFFSEDAEVMMDNLRRLGFEVRADHKQQTIEIRGHGGAVPATHADLFVANAPTAARFLMAFLCLGHGHYRVHGLPRMHDRPMDDVFNVLSALGVRFEANNSRLPAVIHANGLKPGRVAIASRTSGQFAGALLLVADRAGLELVFDEPDERSGHVFMTRQMTRQWGGDRPRDYSIEPDLASAACFIAAGFITNGKVSILNWPDPSLQMDGRFPRLLPPPPRVSHATDLGDSILTLAACGLFGKQPMTIANTGALRVPEHDRIRILLTALREIGARAEETADTLTVWPAEPGQLRGADIDPCDDPLVAMTFAILGLKIPGIRLLNPGCVRRIFPDFFDRVEWLRRVVIAIDGTSGSGKSTLAKTLARHYGFVHVDTGAMYRTLTWLCLQRHITCNDAATVIRAMHEMKAEFQVRDGRILMFVNGMEPGDAIRGEAVNQHVSLVAKIPEVRTWMVARQRELLRFGSLVMEGRDIGSVVFADTPYKIYLDAKPDARAERRARDGYTDQLARRDQLDTSRRISPLVVAPGAFVVDTSQNTPAQTADGVLAELKLRGL